MHRLLQEVMKLYLGAELVETMERSLLEHINIRALFLSDRWVQHEHRWEFAPLLACARQWTERGVYSGALQAHATIKALTNLGGLAENEKLYRRALAIAERSFGLDHPAVGMHLNDLAVLLQRNNRSAEAETLFRRGLAISEQHFGESYPLGNLGQFLVETNRSLEAEPLLRRALSIDERLLGSDHPDIAIRLNNLARSLQAINRLAEAEPLLRRALSISEQSLGPDHPTVAIRLNNVALLLMDTNRLADA